MRILVTGATGFIGNVLIQNIDSNKHDIHALARYVAGRYILGEGINKHFVDLKDYFSVKKLIAEIQPEIVVHLASLSAVSYSYDHPLEVLETNFIGSVNLAEANLRENRNLLKFIFASTSETYGNHNGSELPLKETSEQRPNSPYAVSKKNAEEYLKYMFKAYGFPCIIMRAFNTYGRTRDEHFIIERIITQMLRKKEIFLGDPLPVRDMLYISDHVKAYLKVIESTKDITGEAFNFCTGIGTSIKNIAEIVKKKIGFNGRINWGSIPKRPYDIDILIGDHSKSLRVLEWNPEVTFNKGLDLTIEYWRNIIFKGE